MTRRFLDELCIVPGLLWTMDFWVSYGLMDCIILVVRVSPVGLLVWGTSSSRVREGGLPSPEESGVSSYRQRSVRGAFR